MKQLKQLNQNIQAKDQMKKFSIKLATHFVSDMTSQIDTRVFPQDFAHLCPAHAENYRGPYYGVAVPHNKDLVNTRHCDQCYGEARWSASRSGQIEYTIKNLISGETTTTRNAKHVPFKNADYLWTEKLLNAEFESIPLNQETA